MSRSKLVRAGAILLCAVGLLAGVQASAAELSDKAKELEKALANPKNYDLDPAEWFDGIWSDPVDKNETFREFFVNKHHVRSGADVLVWVYIEKLFSDSPYKVERQRWRISCAEELAGVAATVDDTGTARVIKRPLMTPLPPDSASWLIMQKVCPKN